VVFVFVGVVSYPTMSNRKVIAILIVVLVVLVAAFVAYDAMQTPEPFPVSASDHLTNWALPLPQNSASSTPITQGQIAQFTALLGGGKYPNETIWVAIANDYTAIGEGKQAYQSYEKAIAASSTDALAYDDLGALFDRLYATTSAERAYAQSVALDPSQLLFQLSYLDYLAEVAPTASSTEQAFASAKEVLGATNPDLLIAEAAWLSQIGSTTAAIADWEIVLPQTPPEQQTAIEQRIAALKKQ
jgi:tetratricopeptide (TPR) repeat protein